MQALVSPEIKENYNIVGFDPRGVGKSTPLDCYSDKDLDKIRQEKKVPSIPLNSQNIMTCLLYTSPSPRDRTRSRMPSSA